MRFKNPAGIPAGFFCAPAGLFTEKEHLRCHLYSKRRLRYSQYPRPCSPCSSAKRTDTVKANSASKVEAEISLGNALFQGTGAVSSDDNAPECTGSFGNAYTTVNTALCIRSDATMVNDEFQMTGGACGTGGKAVFTLGSTTAGSCKWEATGPIRGTFSTGGTEAKLSTIDTSAASGLKLIEGGFLCPTSGALSMTFTLETTSGTKVTIS